VREIHDLRWVKTLEARPKCIPQGRPRGVEAAGVRFERDVEAHLSAFGASRGVWFEYHDAQGHGFAQVDFLWRQRDYIIVGEAKLTWCTLAYMQLRKLYFPLLRTLFGLPVGGLVVCKNVTRETPRESVTSEVALALRAAQSGFIPVLHCPV